MIDKEALDKIDNTICLNSQNIKWNIDNEGHIDCRSIDEYIDCHDFIKKHLIALKIIIDKLPDMCTLKVCKTVDEYNEYYDNQENGNYYLTEEAFNLIKEVIKKWKD